jgi:hypothetical protein
MVLHPLCHSFAPCHGKNSLSTLSLPQCVINHIWPILILINTHIKERCVVRLEEAMGAPIASAIRVPAEEEPKLD